MTDQVVEQLFRKVNYTTVAVDRTGASAETKDLEIGQFLLAKFDDESTLRSIGNNRYMATDKSGAALTGAAMTGGFGEVQAGSLEMSNVDITDELVSLIRAQQSFNGAARIMQAEIEVTNKFTG